MIHKTTGVFGKCGSIDPHNSDNNFLDNLYTEDYTKHGYINIKSYSSKRAEIVKLPILKDEYTQARPRLTGVALRHANKEVIDRDEKYWSGVLINYDDADTLGNRDHIATQIFIRVPDYSVFYRHRKLKTWSRWEVLITDSIIDLNNKIGNLENGILVTTTKAIELMKNKIHKGEASTSDINSLKAKVAALIPNLAINKNLNMNEYIRKDKAKVSEIDMPNNMYNDPTLASGGIYTVSGNNFIELIPRRSSDGFTFDNKDTITIKGRNGVLTLGSREGLHLKKPNDVYEKVAPEGETIHRTIRLGDNLSASYPSMGYPFIVTIKSNVPKNNSAQHLYINKTYSVISNERSVKWDNISDDTIREQFIVPIESDYLLNHRFKTTLNAANPYISGGNQTIEADLNYSNNPIKIHISATRITFSIATWVDSATRTRLTDYIKGFEIKLTKMTGGV